jgi:predicted nucleotidyltransferase
MMNYPTVFDLIADVLGEAGVTYALVGGFAINAYQVARQTSDVDLLIAADHLEKACRALENSGYRRAAVSDVVARLEGDGKRLMDIDLLLVDAATLRRVCESGKSVKIAGNEFRVPSLRHLIAMKLHAIKSDPEKRLDKDLPDIVSLMKKYGLSLDDPDMIELCRSFGTPDILAQLRIFFKGAANEKK